MKPQVNQNLLAPRMRATEFKRQSGLVSRGSGGSFRHFFAYGGPANGEMIAVRTGVTKCDKADPTHVQGIRYSYVLVDGPDGRKVFVPEDDQCLRAAFLSSSGAPDDRETETLAAEIQRRGLDAPRRHAPLRRE